MNIRNTMRNNNNKYVASLFWQVSAVFCSLFVLMPIFNIIFVSLGDNHGLLTHLRETVLPRYFLNTAILMAGDLWMDNIQI